MSAPYFYDVYLNYFGEHVGNTTVNNLYNAMTAAGFSTFRIDGIKAGESITKTIRNAIHRSRIYIPVFSEEYPTSGTTLDQLVKIMDIRRVTRRLVLPLYLDDLDESVVREQTGKYFEAFAKHEICPEVTKGKVKAWRCALTEAADLSGVSLKRHSTEAEFIKEVVKEVKEALNPTVPDANSCSNGNTYWLLKWIGSSKGDGKVRGLEGRI